MTYTTRSGIEIDWSQVLQYEIEGLSDRSIAKVYGLSPAGFKKIREKTGNPRKYKKRVRSDKGAVRVPLDIQREKRLRYMREYRHNERGNGKLRSKGKSVLKRDFTVNEGIFDVEGNLMVCTSEYHRGLISRKRLGF